MSFSDIGPRLKALLKERGFTQSEVARQAGMHRATMSSIVKGRHSVTLKTLERILVVLAAGPVDLWPEEYPGVALRRELDVIQRQMAEFQRKLDEAQLVADGVVRAWPRST